jgi:hypothetical protein
MIDPITPKEIEALSEMLDLAIGDQEDYLNHGDPLIDYGAEWPDTAKHKAERFRLVAGFLMRLGLRGQWQRLADLALEMEASGRVYEANNNDNRRDTMEFSETPAGYDARDRWAKRYDELNGAPESDNDQ